MNGARIAGRNGVVGRRGGGATRTLVVFDGELPSVLALAYAAEDAAMSERTTRAAAGEKVGAMVGASHAGAAGSGGLGAAFGVADSGATSIVDVRPLVLGAWAGLPEARLRAEAAAKAVDLLGGELAGDEHGDLTPRFDVAGEGDSRLLLHAAYQAVAAGCTRVVWPVQFGEDLRTPTPSLERVATAVDRAMLVSRVAGLDAPDAAGVEVVAPFVDLSDRQIAEMVMDIEAPLSACWWWGADLPAAHREQDHWGGLLRSLGWGGAIGPA
ncbi:MAG: hypothetical protein R3B68_09590 [Phycisphaerales bacterium]